MRREFKANDIVRIVTDTSRTGQVGRVTGRIGAEDYPNDLWIEFESGDEAPYGDYEMELLTAEMIEAEIAIWQARLTLLKGGKR